MRAQAAEALTSPAAPCAGKPYFITNDDPQPFWGFLGDLLQPLGYGRPSVRLPWRLIFVLALVFELIVWLLKPFMVRQSPVLVNTCSWHAAMLPARALRMHPILQPAADSAQQSLHAG